MKEQKIKVLMVNPGEHPKVVTLENNLKSLQTAVSIDAPYVGLIEIVPLTEDILIICNEEAKLSSLEPCRSIGYDIICGVFYIAGDTPDGDLRSLTDTEISFWSKRFWLPEYFAYDDDSNLLRCWFGDC